VRGRELVGIGRLAQLDDLFEFCLAQVEETALKFRIERSAAVVVIFFVMRLAVFAGAIYGSLKCFQGSVVALLCGLGLAVMSVGWEVIRLLRE
jgi:hypothetical protein